MCIPRLACNMYDDDNEDDDVLEDLPLPDVYNTSTKLLVYYVHEYNTIILLWYYNIHYTRILRVW